LMGFGIAQFYSDMFFTMRTTNNGGPTRMNLAVRTLQRPGVDGIQPVGLANQARPRSVIRIF
jgi:hypothetical protein